MNNKYKNKASFEDMFYESLKLNKDNSENNIKFLEQVLDAFDSVKVNEELRTKIKTNLEMLFKKYTTTKKHIKLSANMFESSSRIPSIFNNPLDLKLVTEYEFSFEFTCTDIKDSDNFEMDIKVILNNFTDTPKLLTINKEYVSHVYMDSFRVCKFSINSVI